MNQRSNDIPVLNPAALLATYQGLSVTMFAATKVMFNIYNHYWNEALTCFNIQNR